MPKSKVRKKKKSQPGRPTPPTKAASKVKGESPTWYVVTMFGLMGLGVLLVVLNYVITDVFGGWGLWAGLLGIAAGFLMTTNYR
jgi:hypothetical protein